MWSDGGELVCIASDEAFYILKYDSQAVQQAVNTNEGIDDDGIEAAFDVREREREGGGSIVHTVYHMQHYLLLMIFFSLGFR